MSFMDDPLSNFKYSMSFITKQDTKVDELPSIKKSFVNALSINFDILFILFFIISFRGYVLFSNLYGFGQDRVFEQHTESSSDLLIMDRWLYLSPLFQLCSIRSNSGLHYSPVVLENFKVGHCQFVKAKEAGMGWSPNQVPKSVLENIAEVLTTQLTLKMHLELSPYLLSAYANSSKFIELIVLQQSLVSSFPVTDLYSVHLQQFYGLYFQNDPSWTIINNQIPQIRNPKNMFNNGVLRAAKTLSKLEKQFSCFKRRQVSKELILSMLEIINQSQKHIRAENLTINNDSKLLKFKRNIMCLIFWRDYFSQSDFLELIKDIRYINQKLKSLGIFKVKKRRNWKLTDKVLRLIMSFDKIFEPQGQIEIGRRGEPQIYQAKQSFHMTMGSVTSNYWPFIQWRSQHTKEPFDNCWQSKKTLQSQP